MMTTFARSVLLILGQTEGVGGGSAPASTAPVEIQSVWDFVVKGGPLMIPIALGSLAALTIIVERLLSLRREKVIPAAFARGLPASLATEADRATALEHCRRHDSPVARIFATGVKRLHEPVELLEKHIEDAGRREVAKLQKYLRGLSVVAAIAPLLGLLGTIFGMIDAFQTVAVSAEALGKTELLASGIYEAMITTAAGLLVAIPSMLGYHLISMRIDRLVGEMDRLTVEFLEAHGPKPGAWPARTVEAARIDGNGRPDSPTEAPSRGRIEAATVGGAS
ncbi:MAG: hypothetical protein BroJett003_09000 [Planctomycetota bacterium]|nr:MAG: hypothetical protein BroJett003_09000 [Planctomycetota bacterium]